MNTVVREAAERLRRVKAGELLVDVYAEKLATAAWGHIHEAALNFVEADNERLAEAYLEQNPADDEEAITREWVYENMTITGYGAKINNFLYLKQSKAGWGIYAFDANSDYVEEQFLVASVTTRRDLRGLLRGMGGNQ